MSKLTANPSTSGRQASVDSHFALARKRPEGLHGAIEPAAELFSSPSFGRDFSHIPVSDRAAKAPTKPAALPPAAASAALLPVRQTTHVQIQPKLEVNEPGDTYELEADRVADLVMQMPKQDNGLEIGPETTKCKSENGKVRRKEDVPATAASRNSETTAAPLLVRDVVGSAGRPLDEANRAFFESRFRRDFSHVRVHTDHQAAESAQALSAQAYTIGSDIVFGGGRFQPETPRGRRLIAHELTHVVQQENRGTRIQRKEHETSKIGTPPEVAQSQNQANLKDHDDGAATVPDVLSGIAAPPRVMMFEQLRQELFRSSLARMTYIQQVTTIPSAIQNKFGNVSQLQLDGARAAANESILLRRAAILDTRNQLPPYISVMNAAEKSSKGMGDGLGFRDVDDALAYRGISPKAATADDYARVVESSGNPGGRWNAIGRVGAGAIVLTYLLDVFRWTQELKHGYMDIPILGASIRLIIDEKKAASAMEGMQFQDLSGRQIRMIGGQFVEYTDPI